MAARLEAMSTNATMDAVKREVAVGAVSLVAKEFMSSTDPYGSRWEPLKRPSLPRTGGPLRKTDAMMNSTMANPTPTGVRVSVNTEYAAYHQYGSKYTVRIGGVNVGTRKMAARMMLPRESYGLPQSWRDMITKSYTAQLRSRIGGG